MNITISNDLGKKLQERIHASKEFSSVDQYIEYILTEVLKQTQNEDQQPYTKEQEDEVKQRLSDLGYMD
ncbi:MAG TPA: CopG family transcriptional regulator [Patescibacteria group bacterium]|nr:CopG family transcriptional regulator [Patescibacteria group bacterium]